MFTRHPQGTPVSTGPTERPIGSFLQPLASSVPPGSSLDAQVTPDEVPIPCNDTQGNPRPFRPGPLLCPSSAVSKQGVLPITHPTPSPPGKPPSRGLTSSSGLFACEAGPGTTQPQLGHLRAFLLERPCSLRPCSSRVAPTALAAPRAPWGLWFSLVRFHIPGLGTRWALGSGEWVKE